jgi:hypothetical protein
MTARPYRTGSWTRTLALTSAAGVTLLLAACSSGSATAPAPSTPATSTSGTASLTPVPSATGASATGPITTTATPTTTTVTTTPAPADPSAATAAAGGGGDSGVRLEVVLTRTSAAGSRTVTVTATTRGLVHQYVNAAGTVLPAATAAVRGTRVTWGDGSAPASSAAGDAQCSATTRLVPVHETITHKHAYARPGHYTITFTVGACAPLHDISRTLAVTVR